MQRVSGSNNIKFLSMKAKEIAILSIVDIKESCIGQTNLKKTFKQVEFLSKN